MPVASGRDGDYTAKMDKSGLPTIHELWSCSKIQPTQSSCLYRLKADKSLEFESIAHGDPLSCDRRVVYEEKPS